MNRSLVMLVLLLVSCNQEKDENNFTTSKYFGGLHGDYGYSISQSWDGGYLISGATESIWETQSSSKISRHGFSDGLILKLNSMAEMEWVQILGDSLYDKIFNTWMINDTTIISTGYKTDITTGSIDVWVVGLSETGEILWEKSIDGGGTDYCFSSCVTQNNNINVLVTSFAETSGSLDLWIIQLDETGNSLWEQRIGGNGSEKGQYIINTIDGGSIIAGSTDSEGQGNFDILVVKLDADGAIEWTQTYGGEMSDWGMSIAEAKDGGYYIGGNTLSYTHGEYDLWILKIDESGAMEWMKNLGGTQNEDLGMISYHRNELHMIATTHSYGNGLSDMWFIKFDSNGEILSEMFYGNESLEYGKSLLKNEDGGFNLLGYSTSAATGEADIWLIMTDENGQTH